MHCSGRQMRFLENRWPAALLLPFSLLYGLVMSVRNYCYDWGILKIQRLLCPVISVGNVTVGGTGKTPTVAFLARYFLSKGKKVCILSRGYGRVSGGTVIVSDGERILASVQEAGDEPFLLAKSLAGVSVIVDEDRVRGGRIAEIRFKPDVILLDDGFQHRRLHRDLDIVTFKSSRPLGNGFVLPAGPLRERLRHLKRADCLWINGDAMGGVDFRKLTGQGKKVINARYVPSGIVDALGRRFPADLAGGRVFAFCGLANPFGFKNSLIQAGATIERFLRFSDHHFYSAHDIETIKKAFGESRADCIMTTEKDWVKLPKEMNYEAHWKYLIIDIRPDDPAQLESMLSGLMATANTEFLPNKSVSQ